MNGDRWAGVMAKRETLLRATMDWMLWAAMIERALNGNGTKKKNQYIQTVNWRTEFCFNISLYSLCRTKPVILWWNLAVREHTFLYVFIHDLSPLWYISFFLTGSFWPCLLHSAFHPSTFQWFSFYILPYLFLWNISYVSRKSILQVRSARKEFVRIVSGGCVCIWIVKRWDLID